MFFLPNQQRTLNKLPTEFQCRLVPIEISLISTNWAVQISAKRAKMCVQCVQYIPAELPFCTPPLVVGFFSLVPQDTSSHTVTKHKAQSAASAAAAAASRPEPPSLPPSFPLSCPRVRAEWGRHVQYLPSSFISLSLFPSPWHLPNIAEDIKVKIKIKTFLHLLPPLPKKRSALLIGWNWCEGMRCEEFQESWKSEMK